MIPKKVKSEAKAAKFSEEVSEFMVLGECEGRCQAGETLDDKRKHCRRMDTVLPLVYMSDGTREGKLVPLGRLCRKHLLEAITIIKKEQPGGNGSEF